MGAHVAVAVERMPVQRAGADKARPVANTAPVSQLDLAAAEDRVLVAAFLAGSQDAFNVIVTRHQPSLVI
jgi:hypothetical protein